MIKEYVYCISDAENEVHLTMEASTKKLRAVIIGLKAVTANDRGEALGESFQRNGAQPDNEQSRTSSDAESPGWDETIQEWLQELATGLLNSSLTSQGTEIKEIHELREDIKKALLDSLDCMAPDKEVKDTFELRETYPLAFKASIITHFLINTYSVEREVFLIEELWNKKEVREALPYVEDQLHRDMDSATKGLERIVELLSAMKKDPGKTPASPVEDSTSDQEASR